MECHSSLMALFRHFEKGKKKSVLQTYSLQNGLSSSNFLAGTRVLHEVGLSNSFVLPNLFEEEIGHPHSIITTWRSASISSCVVAQLVTKRQTVWLSS